MSNVNTPIRLARPGDATALLRIYRPYVESTTANMEFIAPGVEEFQQRISEKLQLYPWLVWEEDGTLLGYAYGSQHRERKGYQWSAEVSIYLAPEAHGQGIAQPMYEELLRLIEAQGVINVYAVITLPNPASVRFHEKLGFREYLVFENGGNKFGQWHDILWMIKVLGKGYHKNPVPPASAG